MSRGHRQAVVGAGTFSGDAAGKEAAGACEVGRRRLGPGVRMRMEPSMGGDRDQTGPLYPRLKVKMDRDPSTLLGFPSPDKGMRRPRA